MASITGSITNAPYTGLYLSDNSFTVTTNFPVGASTSGSSNSLFFPGLDFPTVGKTIIQLTNTALTNSSGSATNYVGLQESSDNVNWNNIAVFTASLLTLPDGGALSTPASTPTSPVQVLLTPQAKQYLRAQATVVAGGATAGGITGSYTIQALFATS